MATNGKVESSVIDFFDEGFVPKSRGRAAAPPDPELVKLAQAAFESGRWGNLKDKSKISALRKAAESVGLQVLTRQPDGKDGPLHVTCVDAAEYRKGKAERKAAREAKATETANA